MWGRYEMCARRRFVIVISYSHTCLFGFRILASSPGLQVMGWVAAWECLTTWLVSGVVNYWLFNCVIATFVFLTEFDHGKTAIHRNIVDCTVVSNIYHIGNIVTMTKLLHECWSTPLTRWIMISGLLYAFKCSNVTFRVVLVQGNRGLGFGGCGVDWIWDRWVSLPNQESYSLSKILHERELVSMNHFNAWKSIQREKLRASKCEGTADSAQALHLKPSVALNSGKSWHCSCLPFFEVYNRTTNE